MVVGLLVAEGAGDVADPGESHKDEGCIGNVIADGEVDLAAGVGFGDKTSPQSPGKFHCSGVCINLKRGCHRHRRWGEASRERAPKTLGKIFFGQLLCKIRAFFGQKSYIIRGFCYFLANVIKIRIFE